MKSGVRLLVAISAALVAGCNQGGDTKAAGPANASANSAAAKPKHPSYCFFKDSETKSWSAARDAQGNVTVKGKAHIEDTAYSAQLAAPEVSGLSATLWLTMSPNPGPYGAVDNWWDVAATVPNSGGVDSVTVRCGTKNVAQLKVPAASVRKS
ncbi:MAG: hypothetical protein ABI454_03085 [Sphingomicrobium sp.]